MFLFVLTGNKYDDDDDERTRTHNLAVGSVCKLRAETLPTQPPRHPCIICIKIYIGFIMYALYLPDH